jgi:Na+/proline symporter
MQNVGKQDKAARAVLTVILLALAWKRQGKMGVIAAFSAGLLLSSVLSGYCPLYKIANINTVQE